MKFKEYVTIERLLVANRGEIAVRILRTASDLGVATVAVFASDDSAARHRYLADVAVPLPGAGVAAYLDMEAIIAVACDQGCDAVHPGYGFLAENEAFAARCGEAGLQFVGPGPKLLALFGDKLSARAAAEAAGVAVLPATAGPTNLEQALAFTRMLAEDGRAAVVKAVSGGGGRGMRVIAHPVELADAFARCESEARAAFGNGALYVEALMPEARHVEVQILGDGTGAVVHLGDRDCSIQRRHQKLVEIAPAPFLPDATRESVTAAAVRLASAAGYANAGTFEFLIDASRLEDATAFAFIEANPRLQVEHTVTEEVFGLDIVAAQLALASGCSLADIGLTQDRVGAPRATAVQVRVNMERMREDGTVLTATGRLRTFVAPSGPGIRVDTFGYPGYETVAGFDSLLAKVIGTGPDLDAAVARAYRALCELQVEGAPTNADFLKNLLSTEAFRTGRITTRFIDDNLQTLTVPGAHPDRNPPTQAANAAHRLDLGDWASVLSYGRLSRGDLAGDGSERPGIVTAPMPGRLIAVEVTTGTLVRAGQLLCVMESMKVEHEIHAPQDGVVRELAAGVGDVVSERQRLVVLDTTG